MPNEKQAGAPLSMADRDGWIWYDGRLVEWRSATTHVLTHSLHYGLAVFEGVRAYKTAIGTAIYRLKEHTERLFNSAHIYMMKIPFTREELMQAQLEVVRENGHEACYVRPIAFYGSEKMGVSPDRCEGARGDRGLALGRVPRARGPREGHPREDLLVCAPPRQRDHGARQDVGHLPELGARDAGGDAARLRRRAAARRRRLRRRRRGREHLRRQGRQDLRARAHVGAHRHHPRLGDRARARSSATR